MNYMNKLGTMKCQMCGNDHDQHGRSPHCVFVYREFYQHHAGMSVQPDREEHEPKQLRADCQVRNEETGRSAT